MSAQPVLSKADYYPRWEAGEFGNKLRAWACVEEWRASGYRGKFGFRYTVPNSPFCSQRHLYHEEAEEVLADILGRGAEFDRIKVAEAAPDDLITLQGEVQDGIGGLDLFFCTVPGMVMRTGLRRFGQHANGLRALETLRRVCWPSSYDDLRELLDVYPNHVVEFSAYQVALGSCRNRNTLIWEVRNY